VERTDLRPGRHRRREDLRSQRAAGVDHRLPAVHPDAAGKRRDGVVGHGEDDELDLLDEGRRLREAACSLDPASKRLAPTGITARHGVDGPARPGEGDAEGGPDGTRADDPDDRRLLRSAPDVRMRVIVLVLDVAVPVPSGGRHGIELDARGSNGGGGLRVLPDIVRARGLVVGPRGFVVPPRPHRVGRGRGEVAAVRAAGARYSCTFRV
jgi:hypothetical protein